MDDARKLFNLKLILVLIFLIARLIFYIFIYINTQLYQLVSFFNWRLVYADFVAVYLFGDSDYVFSGPAALVYGFLGMVILLIPVIYFTVAPNKRHTYISYSLFILIISWGYFNFAKSF